MQFNGIRVDRVIKGEGNQTRSTSQLLSLYNESPQEELTLDDFELYALDRLQLLRGIEKLKIRNFDQKEYTARLTKVGDMTTDDKSDSSGHSNITYYISCIVD